MEKKIKVTDTFVAKPTPSYIAPISNEKNGIFSKWFNERIAKYVVYHTNNRKLNHFKNLWILKICIYFFVVFVLLFLCIYSVEDLDNANATAVWGISITVLSAVASITVLGILFFHVLYSCIFFHKSFVLFIKEKDFSNASTLKRYPRHTRKYLYQYGIIDKKVYELIKKKK